MKSWKLGLAILFVLIALAVAPTTATAQTFDNSGGGVWKEYFSFPITTAPTEYAQYKIVINGTTWELYNVTGALEASGTNNNFWSLVNPTGADIRVFNQNYNQLYFWIEYFNATEQKATIWVNLTAGSSELNIAYGNSLATKSDYEDPEQVFEFFDDFEGLDIDKDVYGYYDSNANLPKAIAHGHSAYYDSVSNRLYVVFLSNDGKHYIYYYDFNTGEVSKPVLLPIEPTADLAHGQPAIVIDNDGYIWVFGGSHDTLCQVARSKNPRDISEWDTLSSIGDGNYPDPGGVTYPQPIVVSDGILVIMRYHESATWYDSPVYMFKTTDGSAWQKTKLVEVGTAKHYPFLFHKIGNKIVGLVSPRNLDGDDYWHGVLFLMSDDEGQTWKKADGTTYTLPVNDSQADWIVKDLHYEGWDVNILPSGKPVALVWKEDTSDLYLYKWNGTAWEQHHIDNLGDLGPAREFGFIKVTDENTIEVYTLKNISGVVEVVKYKTTDGGSTWSMEQITSNSACLNARIEPVEPVGNGAVYVIWNYGSEASNTTLKTYPSTNSAIPCKGKWIEENSGGDSYITDTISYHGLKALAQYSGSDWTFIRHKFPSPITNVIVECMYYVNEAENQESTVEVENLANGYWMYLKKKGTNPGEYDYRTDASGGDVTISGLTPTTGWHKFWFKVTPSGTTGYIDDYEAYTYTTLTEIDAIRLRSGWGTGLTTYKDLVKVIKLADPADFGTPLVKLFQKKFGTKTVYVNVTYLDTSVTERYNPTAYYKLEDKPQINVTSMLSVSGVNATDGANISIELIDFVTLDKVVYNRTEVTANLTYQGTITNSTTGYTYNVYSFTTYENGVLEIYGYVGNKAYEATFKLDGETVDVFNVTAVVGEPLEILLPHIGNVTIASTEYTEVTSVSVNTKDLEVGAKTLEIKIEDPENFAVGYRYGTVNIDWGKVYFNVTDLQNKTLARTTYGFFNKNFSILSTDPTKLYAGDIEIDVYFHGVKLKSLEIHLNHTNNGLTLNVSVNATQFKDYRNITRIIASPNYFEAENLSTKYPFSVMKLINVSGTVVIDYVSSPPTSVKVEGATSYTYEKPVLKITASGNVTITDLYKLSTPLKDRLGNPVNFYVLINGSRVDASKGVASKLLKPSWYEVEVPITVSGFELWKFNDSSNIALVEINTSDKTLPTAEYRVPTKIETKEVRIQKTKFPWLPFPFLSESKPAQEEAPIVRLEGTLRDYYNAPIANRMIKIEVASPNFTRIYNVTTDSSGNFKIDVDMARGVEYKVTYKFAGDDVYVGTSTTKTFTIEQLLPAPPEEMTITELLIFVGIAVGLVAVVAGAIYLAKRTKAKTLARMESEFKFFRRLK